ncbi:MAG: 30S ribosomal protein S17 [Nitrososphaeraceae archaeon]|jgi:small subunit ribosomal protein S17
MVRNIGVTVVPPKRTCEDELCPFHGHLSIRGKILTGVAVSSKANKMIVVSREYPRPVRKYKRYERSSSKVHAFLPQCIDVKEGDEVKISECRQISKTISFVVIEVSGNVL